MLLQVPMPGFGHGQGTRPLRLIGDLLDSFPLLAPYPSPAKAGLDGGNGGGHLLDGIAGVGVSHLLRLQIHLGPGEALFHTVFNERRRQALESQAIPLDRQHRDLSRLDRANAPLPPAEILARVGIFHAWFDRYRLAYCPPIALHRSPRGDNNVSVTVQTLLLYHATPSLRSDGAAVCDLPNRP